MKILFIIPSYEPAYIYGGTIIAVSELAKALAKEGNIVTVYTTNANGKSELDVPLGKSIAIDDVNVFYFKRVTGDHTHMSPHLWIKLWKTCKDFDVVHLHSWWSLLLLGAAMICRLKKITFILSPCGMLSTYTFLQKNSFLKNFLHHIIGKRLLESSYLHATTRLEWEDCLKVNAEWKGFILYNLVDLPKELPACPDEKGDSAVLTLGFLSRIDHKKGLEILFKALAQIGTNYRLRIAGDGDQKYIEHLKHLAEKLLIGERIEWCGWQQGSERFKFLKKLDLFVLTSYNENFAIVITEALAMGTPVLVTEGVGLADYVKRNDMGWVCKATIQSVRNCLQEISNNREDLFKIVRTAPAIVLEEFNNQKLAQRYLVEYRLLLSQNFA